MATRLQIRRGTGTTPPDDIRAGELAFSTDVGMLFVGTGEAIPNHYKLINSIENLGDLQITADSTELNVLNGILASTSELNILNGVTVNANELNLLGEGNYTEPLGTDDFQNLINLTTLLNSKSDTDHTHTLGQLSNVSNTTPSNGQVLKWNGTAWAPAEDSDEAVNLESLGITVTAAKLNAIDDKLSKTASGQVITQNITIGPVGQVGDEAGSKQIIFRHSTPLDDENYIDTSLGTNSVGELIFEGNKVLTTGIVGQDFLNFNQDQILTQNQKEQGLENLGVTATPTEINYLSGVQSAIQTQLSAKAIKLNPIFEGTVTLPNTGSGANEAATKSYVDTQIAQNLSGSGVYTETVLANLETSGTFSFSAFSTYDKVMFTLYPVKSANFISGTYNAQTVPVYPELELARMSDTIADPSGAGTCIGAPQYDDDGASCVIQGYVFDADEVTYFKNGNVDIGPDGAYVRRVDSANVQFIQPAAILGLTWKLRVTGVTF
jgi:hypothetical protein